MTVASGAAFAPRVVSFAVTAESGASRSYRVRLVRRSVYVKASNADASDRFATSIALSADGSTMAVGAYLEASAATGVGGDASNNAAGSAGAVYVYRRTAGIWAQEAYVKAANAEASDRFGWSVALSADGSSLAVGALGEGSASTGLSGDPANLDVFDQFGVSVALSGSGDTLAVGASFEDSAALGIGGAESSNTAPEAGAAYVFRRDAAGAWTQESYIKASNTTREDYFGCAVSLSGDGSTLAVGARLEDSSARGIGGNESDESALQAGAVYTFRRSGAAAWAQTAYVKASNAGANDQFGVAVAISADASTLAIGASAEDSAARGIGGDETNNAAVDAGAVYVF